MSKITSQLESILFVASTPLGFGKIVKILGVKKNDIVEAVEELVKKYNHGFSGIHIVEVDGFIQMVTNPSNSEYVEQFTKSEVLSELTPAQLETLTVIAYRGPITRPELEQIRGVNCAVILRNLLMRGLITEEDCHDKIVSVYNISIKAMSHLGINNINQLPDYINLHSHENLEKILEE